MILSRLSRILTTGGVRGLSKGAPRDEKRCGPYVHATDVGAKTRRPDSPDGLRGISGNRAVVGTTSDQ